MILNSIEDLFDYLGKKYSHNLENMDQELIELNLYNQSKYQAFLDY